MSIDDKDNWKVSYENDVGENDEYFVEWNEVSNGDKTFRTDTQKDAEWLRDILNNHDETMKVWDKLVEWRNQASTPDFICNEIDDLLK